MIAPPYDVLTADEARALATDPMHFVHVTRPEVDLEIGTDPHSLEAWEKGRDNLKSLRDQGTLLLDDTATYYLYGQQMGEHRQVGVIAACSVDEYDAGTIKKHEYTRPDKEDDRTRHMEVLDAQVGLVFLTHRAHAGLAAILDRITATAPAWRVTTEDGVEHALWPAPQSEVDGIRSAYEELDALYIADGHHRSAAASRVHANRQNDRSSHFLAGLFPDDRLQVMAYNRVIHDLNGHTPEAFLEALAANFTIEPGTPTPPSRGTFSMYFQGAWHVLTPRQGVVNHDDPVARLDVSVLQDRVLGPVLGIKDPRRSTRITFVGGIRGHEALSSAVEAGAAVAFHMFPTGLDQLLEVADAGEVMPPKSTWFEPKLREGVVTRLL